MADEPQNTQNAFVTHNEFSEFKEADSQWKRGISGKIDALVDSFSDYRANQSNEQSWRSMLPLISLLVVIGVLVAAPVYRDMARTNAELDKEVARLNAASTERDKKQAKDIEQIDIVLQREMRELDAVQQTRIDALDRLLQSEVRHLKEMAELRASP